MFTTGAVVGGVAGVGFLGAVWSSLQRYWERFIGLFFITVTIQGPAAYAMSYYLVHNYRCLFNSRLIVDSTDEFVRPERRNMIVCYSLISALPTWWYGHRRLFTVTRKDMTLVDIGYLRFTMDASTLLLEAVAAYNSYNNANTRKVDRFYIRRLSGNLGRHERSNGRALEPMAVDDGQVAKASMSLCDKLVSYPMQWTREQLGQPLQMTSMATLSLVDDQQMAVDEAVRWRESETWFKDRGVPWKRGWLLYGAPGTGKTAFTRALGQTLNMPIYLFDLPTMSNQDFAEAWSKTRSNTPCIALFEDIDNVFNGRKNVANTGMEQGLTFDCLLNALDGVENTDGLFIVLTTNDVSKVDPAIGNLGELSVQGIVDKTKIATRPGRVDRLIKFNGLDEAGRLKMARRILGEFPMAVWEGLIAEGAGDSGAQFQERCCRVALKLFWDNK